MNVLIRNVDESVISVIDALASKSGKSREEYLRMQIRLITLAPEIKALDDKYERIAELSLASIAENTELLTAVKDILEKHKGR